jgi:hypothetical protein
VACGAYSANCSAQQLSPSEQLRTFGDSMVKGTWHQTLPANMTSKHTYKWALGKEFLIVFMQHEGKPNALAIVGVDPRTKRQTWWRFQDDGVVQITSVDVVPVTPTKDKVSVDGAGVFDAESKGSDVLEITPQAGAMLDGKPAERESWKRSSEVSDLSWLDSDPSTTVAKQISLAPLLSGKKWIKGVLPEGIEFWGASHGKWILNGHFHIVTGSMANSDQTAWSDLVITGIDPKTGMGASWEFISTGAISEFSYDDSGMSIHGDHILSNGDKLIFKGDFSVDFDSLRYRSKTGPEGEEPKPYGWSYRNAE